MGKLIFWVVVIVAALLAARLVTRSAHKRNAASAAPPSQAGGTELMVRCAHCGIMQPSSEAVRRKGYNYCSLAHSLKGPRAG